MTKDSLKNLIIGGKWKEFFASLNLLLKLPANKHYENEAVVLESRFSTYKDGIITGVQYENINQIRLAAIGLVDKITFPVPGEIIVGGGSTVISGVSGSTVNINTNNFSSIPAASHEEPKVSPPAATLNSVNSDIRRKVEEILNIHLIFLLFYAGNRVVHPEICKEAKQVADELIEAAETVITSTDDLEVEEIMASLPEFAKALTELKERAKKELKKASSDEKKQVLQLLSEDTPSWPDFKRAYKLLEQAGKAELINFPKIEPISTVKKRQLKLDFINAFN